MSSFVSLTDLVYPVGSYFFSNTSNTPASCFGGTWTVVTGRFLYANASTATGGANTHTLTVAQMPSHNHALTVGTSKAAGSANMSKTVASGSSYYAAAGDVGEIKMANTGSSQARNNMPAYRSCYCWYRTA